MLSESNRDGASTDLGVDALCRLAAANWRDGNAEAAVAALRAAQMIAPDRDPGYVNLGMVLRAARLWPAAASVLRRAIWLWPDRNATWRHFLLTRAACGDGMAACAAMVLEPERPEAYGVLADMKRHDDAAGAAIAWARGLRIEPHRHDWTTNLVAAHFASGHADRAVATARGATDGGSGDPIRLSNLSAALLALGNASSAARAAAGAAVQLPADAGSWSVSLAAAGRDTAIVDLFRLANRLLRCAPWSLSTEVTIGIAVSLVRPTFALIARERFAAAWALLRVALVIAPADGDAWTAFGSVHHRIGEPGRSATSFGRASLCLFDHARGEARALELDRARLNLLLLTPGTDPEQFFLMHLALVERHRPADLVRPRPLFPRVVPAPERRLRIGYMSSDLRNQHPAARQLIAMLAHHDRSRFVPICYATHRQDDDTTAALRAQSSGWRDISRLTDHEAAEQIRRDGIDVLMVLAGRFDQNRPFVAAYRPAPVQVSYFEEATLGLVDIDYMLADQVETPRRTTEWFTERVVHLPVSDLWPIPGLPMEDPTPALRTGVVTFGCFGSPAKVGDATLDMWAATLNAVPGARLVLKYREAYADSLVSRRVMSAFVSHGVEAHRIELRGRRDTIGDHLSGYADIDVALDTSPFNGITTTREALSMGVPVVTLAGWNRCSRRGAGMLRTARCDDLVATDPMTFVKIAACLSADHEGLDRRRRAIRAAIAKSARVNHARFVRHLERAYRAMWRRWCALQGGR
jgi:tetratricopeptide (TPR) repeat protein